MFDWLKRALVPGGDTGAIFTAVSEGLGFTSAQRFEARGLPRCYTAKIVRREDGSGFATEESWLLVHLTAEVLVSESMPQRLADAARTAQAAHVLALALDAVDQRRHAQMRAALRAGAADLVLLHGELATALTCDFVPGSVPKGTSGTPPRTAFSIRRLRQVAADRREVAPWTDRYQPMGLLPRALLSLHESALEEADLYAVLATGSCLVLGEPGAGKTTLLHAAAAELARSGGRTPVFVSLGTYRGDLWALLKDVMGSGGQPLSDEALWQILESGAIVPMLDGLNEIQEPRLRVAMFDELRKYTDLRGPLAHVHWLVSGRVRDYDTSQQRLPSLEHRRWEVRPLTPDLVFRYLVHVLGKAKAETLYEDMDPSLRRLCTSPLSLSIVAYAYKLDPKIPTSRPALYKRVIEDLIERSSAPAHLALQRLLSAATANEWGSLAVRALRAVAERMQATALDYREAVNALLHLIPDGAGQRDMARALLDQLLGSKLLAADTEGNHHVRFLHHTFQEYFRARAEAEAPLNVLLSTEAVSRVNGSCRLPAERREIIRFAADFRDDRETIIVTLLASDIELASDIAQDVAEDLSEATVKALTLALTKHYPGDMYYHDRVHPNAQSLSLLAQKRGTTGEQLLTDAIKGESAEAQLETIVNWHLHNSNAKSALAHITMASESGVSTDIVGYERATALKMTGALLACVEAWTQYINRNGSSLTARGNRASALADLGRYEEALRDYEVAVSDPPIASLSFLFPKPSLNSIINYAALLSKMGRDDEAKQQLDRGLQLDPLNPSVLRRLARIADSAGSNEKLRHLQRLQELGETSIGELEELLAYNQQEAHHVAALATLEQLLERAPMSDKVPEWKRRMIDSRRAIGAITQQRSERESVLEARGSRIENVVWVWLREARFIVTPLSSTCLLANRTATAPAIPVVMLVEPEVTEQTVRAALASVPAGHHAKVVLVSVTKDSLQPDAHATLANESRSRAVALVTIAEVRETLRIGGAACSALFDDALRNSRPLDPFLRKGRVLHAQDFWGRDAERVRLRELVAGGQSFGLYGIHKVGKSSLLGQIRRDVVEDLPDIVPIEVELHVGLRTGKDVIGAILRELVSAAPWIGAINPESASGEILRRAVELATKGTRAARGCRRVLLLLDEYAYLIPEGPKERGVEGFAEVLGVLKALMQQGILIFVPCGRTAALSRAASFGDEENPMLDQLHSIFLAPHSRDEHHDMLIALAARAQRHHITFTPDALDAIFVETGGHPGFSRGLGSVILNQGSGAVSVDRVMSATKVHVASRDHSTTPLAIYESRMSYEEQRIARAVGLQGSAKYNELFSVGATREQRVRTRDAIANLVDTTVLMVDGDGESRRFSHRYGLIRRAILKHEAELGQ
jgi:tetratricopeptide (TPR) repeat protein